jgi:hypothetical protein
LIASADAILYSPGFVHVQAPDEVSKRRAMESSTNLKAPSPIHNSLLRTATLETATLETAILETAIVETAIVETAILETAILETETLHPSALDRRAPVVMAAAHSKHTQGFLAHVPPHKTSFEGPSFEPDADTGPAQRSTTEQRSTTGQRTTTEQASTTEQPTTVTEPCSMPELCMPELCMPELCAVAEPPGERSTPEPRSVMAWRTWLGALAIDAEAAQAAALAYERLDASGRDAWIESLAQDARVIGVPRIALYAPLLAVEVDGTRRDRIQSALGPHDSKAAPRQVTRALVGFGRGDLKVAVLVSPLYMDFAQVMACGYRVGEAFEWVRHDPIVSTESIVRPGSAVDGVIVEPSPLKGVIDELALTIVAHNRTRGQLPATLRAFAHVFGPNFGCA